MPPEAVQAGCADIARQLIEVPYGDGLEVAMGGGRSNFLPEATAIPRTRARRATARMGRI